MSILNFAWMRAAGRCGPSSRLTRNAVIAIALFVGLSAGAAAHAQTYVGHYEATAPPWLEAGITEPFQISGTFVFENVAPQSTVLCDELPSELEYGPCRYSIVSHNVTIAGQEFESYEHNIMVRNLSPDSPTGTPTTDRYQLIGAAGVPDDPDPDSVFYLNGVAFYLINFGTVFDSVADMSSDALANAALPTSEAGLAGFPPLSRRAYISFGVVGGNCCGSHGGTLTSYTLDRAPILPVTIDFESFDPGLYDGDFLAAYGIANMIPGGAPGAAGPRTHNVMTDWGFKPGSPPNIFYQHWTQHDRGQLHWLDIYFEPELTAFSLKRIGFQVNRSFNPWGAKFYGVNDEYLGEFRECNSSYCFDFAYAPKLFAFEAPAGQAIARMRFWSNWYASTTRNIFVDDFVLTRVAEDDEDGDGVINVSDLCPGTLSGLIDANGCSVVQVDQDFDGICNPDVPSTGPNACAGSDNCPTVSNADQLQTGNNVGGAYGDACVDPTVDIPDNADIAPDVTIGADSDINTGVIIKSGAELGDNVTLNRNSSIGEDTIIADNTSLNQGSTIGSGVTIGDGASIGADAVIGDGTVIGAGVFIGRNVVIGDRVVIGANTYINQDVDIGNDATIGMIVVLGKKVTVQATASVPDFANVPKNAVITP